MEKLRKDDPERIGPYDLIARLGAGGMGVVFLGTRGVDRYAIKVVRSSFLDDPSLKTRFLREIETLKRVSSPYVARFLDSSIDEDLAWHAVEFVNGPNLRELVDSKVPLGESDWWELAGQLKKGLESIHSLGIVHRDIKPSNIIMSESGMKLIDFGISQDSEATSLTTTGMVAGSPAWLSPEQLEGTDVSASSDLFSAGSVLTFAATGRSPWGQETSMSVPVVYQKILSGEISLQGLSDAQRTVVSNLLQRDPELRSFGISIIGSGQPAHTSKQPSLSNERNAPRNSKRSASSKQSLPRASQEPLAGSPEFREIIVDASELNGVPARPQRYAQMAVFIWLMIIFLGAVGWLLSYSWPSESASHQADSSPSQSSGVASLSERWSECDLGQSAIDESWRILEMGSSEDELTLLEDELNARIGGANIGVSAESPNSAKRALYVVRTAVRLALSRGSFDAPSLNDVFADSNAIMMGLNAFRSTCGNPKNEPQEATNGAQTPGATDTVSILDNINSATITWWSDSAGELIDVTIEDAPGNVEVTLTSSDWMNTNPMSYCPSLTFDRWADTFTAFCGKKVGSLNQEYLEQPSTLLVTSGGARKIAYVYFSRIGAEPTSVALR